MNPEIAAAAQTLADHALLLLAIGIALLAAVVVTTVAAIRLLARHQEWIARISAWLLSQIYRLPVLGPRLRNLRIAVPSRYVLLHLALGLVATAGVTAFVTVAEEVFTGQAAAQFDHALAAALRNSASPQWQHRFRIITWFGSAEALGIASALVALVFLVRRRFVLAIGWIVAQIGAGVLVVTLKSVFERTRPAFADAVIGSGWSFPSGHATRTFVFCGLATYLLLRNNRSTSRTVVIGVAAATWCFVIGFTRLYLGVHYASDVAAGLVAAAAWVAVCVSAIELGLRRLTSPPAP
jgi:membrane-associated phospholipid phosphatase